MLRYLLACLLFITHTAALGQAGGRPAPNVIVQSVAFEAMSTSVEAVGSAEAKQSVDIFSAVADKVISVNFTPGQNVSKGDVLLELDARKQQAALQRAHIQLMDETRNVALLEQSSTTGAVTQSALDDAKTRKALAEVMVLDAQIALDDRRVSAPFSGVVGLTDVEVGDRISTNTLITTIDNRSQLFINFNAPESSLNAITKGKGKVTLQPWSNRNVQLVADIAQLDSRVNERDRTIRVRALLDNSEEQFLPGMSFRVRLEAQGSSFAVVPESALSWGANDAYVWLLKGDKAHRVTVEIKQRLLGRLLVESDLASGDVLIVEGIQRLRPGLRVTVVEQRDAL